MACSDDTESVMTPDASTSIPDTGAHPDATTNLGADAGINVDADLTPDAEPPDWDFGTKIADIPADLIAVTPDEKEVIYVKRVLNRDRIFAYETETGMTREIDSNSTYSIYTTNKDETRGIVTTRPVMWYFSDLLRNVSESGKLRTYNTMTKDVTLVAEDAAKDVLAVSPNGAWAIATEAYDVERGTDSSTRTADVIMLSADGSEKITLIQNASMGLWDGSEDSFAGRCALRAAWTSSVTVAMIGCPSSTKQATLYIADVVTKTSSVVSENASGYLNANSDYEYFFWSTRDGDVYVSSTDTSTTIKLVATSTVEEISFIDERRFAFNTVADELHIASWPVTTSTIIQTFGVENIRRVSPTKDYLLFSQSDDFISDLYKISTSTTQIDRFTQLEVNGQAYPGDDAFSVDGERVFWYQRTNPNLIGDITTALTDGTGPEVELTRQAYWVFNYADPTRVVLLVNAVQIRQGRIISDLVTRARDGSDDLEVLVGGLLAQPRDFLLFPKTKQIAYHVPEGYAPGIYIRELP
ncbi:MAG: hypothetical protein VYC39_08340 [Myxococcota bacterium]|nr:hypothetical protein [Myxococcota bacterium]